MLYYWLNVIITICVSYNHRTLEISISFKELHRMRIQSKCMTNIRVTKTAFESTRQTNTRRQSISCIACRRIKYTYKSLFRASRERPVYIVLLAITHFCLFMAKAISHHINWHTCGDKTCARTTFPVTGNPLQREQKTFNTKLISMFMTLRMIFNP